MTVIGKYFKPKIVVILSFLWCTSCYYENEEDLYGSLIETCDLTEITYGIEVKALLNTHCTVCHSTSSAASIGANIVLDDYALLSKYVDNGKLMGSINHGSGYQAMPKSGAKLPACDIAKVQIWIDNGASND